MFLPLSDRAQELLDQVMAFMDEHVYPNEARYHEEIAAGDRWQPVPVLEEVKAIARGRGLWNLFLPESEVGAGLTNYEYAHLCEQMGRSPMAPESFNCSAPDTGNMEVLVRYGTDDHRRQWLEPLLAGEIRSAFAMTEPAVASSRTPPTSPPPSGARETSTSSTAQVVTSGIGDPRCKILIFMGKTDVAAARYRQQSMILVPRDTPGVKVPPAALRVRL